MRIPLVLAKVLMALNINIVSKLNRLQILLFAYRPAWDSLDGYADGFGITENRFKVDLTGQQASYSVSKYYLGIAYGTNTFHLYWFVQASLDKHFNRKDAGVWCLCQPESGGLRRYAGFSSPLLSLPTKHLKRLPIMPGKRANESSTQDTPEVLEPTPAAPSENEPSKKRRRRILSCDPCRRLKCRCEIEYGSDTCSRCRNLRWVLKCVSC